MDEKFQEMISDIKEIQPFFYGNIAEMFIAKGYRNESDTAKEILKWLVWNKHLFNRTHEIGFEKPRTSYLIMSDEIEELAEKYGVDLTEDKE